MRRRAVLRGPWTCLTRQAAVRVDGELNDEIWRDGYAHHRLSPARPQRGGARHVQTEARIAYDATGLYVAVRAFDPEPQRIVGIRTRRDESSPSDWVAIIVDSFHDRRSGYEFAVNPAGVKSDAYWYNDTNNDQGWDAVWDVAVSRDASGWRAEFRIPFSQLRYQPSDTSTFGLAVIRKVGRLNETSTWPLLAKSANGYVSSFGELTGLRLDRSPKRLEVVPYLVGDIKTQPSQAPNPLSKATDPTVSAGMDLKYALGPGLTLTATLNPDFGQVEADPAEVNLGLRVVLLRAAPILRRGLRHLPDQLELRWRLRRRAVLLAPHRTLAPRQRDGARRRLRVGAWPDDDSRGGQADRPHRSVFGRRTDGADLP